jgi:hypothetical protein
MKWNTINVSGACLVIGLGGFMIGKLSGGKAELSDNDRLLRESERMIQQRFTDSGPGSRNDQDSNRPNRPGKEGGSTSSDQKLVRMEEIVRGENALDRGRAMLEWIDSLAPEEFEAAVARFRSLGLTEARMGEYAMLLTAWAEVDPLAALAYTTKNTTSGMATSTVLSAWANRDPEAAIAWAKSNHEGEGANPYMVGIIRGMVETNRGRATQLLQEMPFSAERGEALAAIIPHVIKDGTEASKKWISEIKDERLREGATARFAEEMAKNDPAGTATWLLANLTPVTERSVDEVYTEWAKADPSAAMSSFESLPQGGARSRALRGMVVAEIRNDPAAAAQLMNRYPADLTDSTVQHFIWHSFGKAPEIAANQIGMIKDEGSRNRMYERALGSWLERDQAAARKWIDSANLPANVVQSLGNR